MQLIQKKTFKIDFKADSVGVKMSEIQRSELAKLNDESLYGSKCLTAGWGLTRTNGHRSAVLRKAVTMNGSKKISCKILNTEFFVFLTLIKSRGFSNSFMFEASSFKFQEIDAYLFCGPRWGNL